MSEIGTQKEHVIPHVYEATVIVDVCFSENVELILQGIGSRHNSESQDNDQPDYDSVASDEDPVLEARCGDSCNDGRAKVRL